MKNLTLLTLLFLLPLGINATPSQNSVQETMEETTAFPYDIEFSDSNWQTWKLWDANNDSYKWRWYQGLYYLANSSKSADDWLLSPAFNFKKDFMYELTYTLYENESKYNNVVYVNLNGSNTSIQDTSLIQKINVTYTEKRTETKRIISKTDQIQYVGFHVTSYKSQGKVFLYDFHIKELGSKSAPLSVSNLKITPGEMGVNEATLSFTAPTTNMAGETLEAISKIDIFREDELTPAHTINSPTTGTSLEWTDTEAYPGETFYTVVAYAGELAGEKASQSLYVGIDIPTAVTNITLNEINGKVYLAWNSPQTTVHNGYLDFSTITYMVSRVAGEEFTTLISGTINTSYIDDSFDPTTQQAISYQITPFSGAGAGINNQSKIFSYGNPYEIPYSESFSNQAYQTSPWRQEIVIASTSSTQPLWSFKESLTYYDDNDKEVPLTSQDIDKGFISLNPTGSYTSPSKGRLISPAINIKDAANPILKFWIYRESMSTYDPANYGGRNDDQLQIEVSGNNGKFYPVENALFHRYGTDNKWVECEVSLAAFKQYDRINIGFTGIGMGGGRINIDHITIDNGTAFDMEAITLEGPSKLRVGDEGKYIFTYKNGGGNTVTDYDLELYYDDILFQTIPGTSIKPCTTSSYIFQVTPEIKDVNKTKSIYAKITYGQDLDISNNQSKTISTEITEPLFPIVSTLKATAESHKVTISWNMPDSLSRTTLALEDDIESYESFIIENIGEYTLYDLDNRTTYGVTSAGAYPHISEKIAFQVFNPSLTAIDPEEIDILKPHSGEKFLASFAPYNSMKIEASNDWLVSPKLSGYQQTISFYARCVSDEYPETFIVYYANINDPEPEDFHQISEGAYITTQSDWKQYKYILPKGALHFAIRCTSYDGYVFMVDDIAYERSVPDANSVGLSGYNLYRNKEKVNAEPIPANITSYEDNVEEDGTYTYQLSALYPNGESLLSNQVQVTTSPSDIDNVQTINIHTDNCTIIANGIQGLPVSIFSVNGILLFNSESGDDQISYTTPGNGMYMMKIGNQVMKIIIK